MLEKLDFMVRFWDLKARHAAQAPLSPLERGELLSLLSLMVADDPMPEPCGAAPRPDSFPVQVATRGGFATADARYVCAIGFVVVGRSSLEAGQSTIVRLAIPGEGVEYTLPCVVEWTFTSNDTTIALRVDGAPTRTEGVPIELGAWGVPLGGSDSAWTPEKRRGLGPLAAPS